MADSSLAAQFGRKPAMYALWCVLAVSVLCESLAQKWQVWVGDQSSLNLIQLTFPVCGKALRRYWCRIPPVYHPNLRFRNCTHSNSRIAPDPLQLLVGSASLFERSILIYKVLSRITIRAYCPPSHVDQRQIQFPNSHLYSGQSE